MVMLLVYLAVLGVIAWFIETYLANYIRQPFRALMHIILIFMALFILLNTFGLINTPLPR